MIYLELPIEPPLRAPMPPLAVVSARALCGIAATSRGCRGLQLDRAIEHESVLDDGLSGNEP